jgi:hypothetical protein
LSSVLDGGSGGFARGATNGSIGLVDRFVLADFRGSPRL